MQDYHLNELNQLYQSPTSEKRQHSTASSIPRELWAVVWSRLQAAKLVWEEVDSSTSLYWMDSLKGKTEADLMRGCDLADNWTGRKADFTLGVFKEMCRKPVSDASHRPFKALPKPPVDKGKLKALMAQTRSLLASEG